MEFSLGYNVNFASAEATWGDPVHRQTGDRQRECEKSLQTGLCAKNKDKTVRSECAEHVRSQLH